MADPVVLIMLYFILPLWFAAGFADWLCHKAARMLPLMAAAFVTVLHWPQFLAIFGLGSEPARFDLTWKRAPLPIAYIATVLAAALRLEALPYLEELRRGLRAAGGRLVPPRQGVRTPQSARPGTTFRDGSIPDQR